MRYFNSNLRTNKTNIDQISLIMDQIRFKVFSVGVWNSLEQKSANYTIDDIEFIFYTKGKTITSMMGKDYLCTPNTLLTLYPKGLYSSSNIEGNEFEYYFIHFNVEPKIFEYKFLNLWFNNNRAMFIDDPLIFNLIKAMHTEYQSNPPGSASCLNALLKILIITIIRQQQNSLAIVESSFNKSNTKAKLVNQCIEYINQNIYSELNISEIATIFNVSTNQLYKSFTTIIGISPIKFIIEQKMMLAEEMLLSKSFTIEEISERLSFSDIAVFSRSFKKYTGLSPTQFQNNYSKLKSKK